MRSQSSTDNSRKKFLDIHEAAESAGFTSRHFRKIIEEDSIPVLQIDGKMFIGVRDLETWKSTRGEMRLQAALQQVDGWISKDAARSRMELTPTETDF